LRSEIWNGCQVCSNNLKTCLSLSQTNKEFLCNLFYGESWWRNLTDHVLVEKVFFAFLWKNIFDGLLKLILFIRRYDTIFTQKTVSDQIKVFFNSFSSTLK
jgi:hypothetical protein